MKPRLLFDRDTIARRVRELAGEIAEHYRGRSPVLLGVLTGAYVFLADLSRALGALGFAHEIGFVKLRSYVGTRSSGSPEIELDVDSRVRGRHVLVVEDIVDTGRTARSILERVREQRAESAELCALLDKSEAREVPLEIRYVGFRVPRVFVVGYGIDCDGKWRELEGVYALDG